MLFQTGMNFFFLLNTKVDILKNVNNQTVASTHWFVEDPHSSLFIYVYCLGQAAWL